MHSLYVLTTTTMTTTTYYIKTSVDEHKDGQREVLRLPGARDCHFASQRSSRARGLAFPPSPPRLLEFFLSLFISFVFPHDHQRGQ